MEATVTLVWTQGSLNQRALKHFQLIGSTLADYLEGRQPLKQSRRS